MAQIVEDRQRRFVIRPVTGHRADMCQHDSLVVPVAFLMANAAFNILAGLVLAFIGKWS